jgi:hypothetical protein
MKASKTENRLLKWLSRSIEWLFASVLVAVGLLGTFHEVLEYAGVHLRDPGPFTLRIAGLLALALGLERFTRFAHFERHILSFEKRFDGLQKDIHARLGVGLAEGYEEVYDEASELVRGAEFSIRTIVFANRPIASEKFVNTVVEHLRSHKMVTYDVTLGVDLSAISEEFWEGIEKRNTVYREAGVASRAHLTILDTTKPIGFDVLIIDDRHCAMSLSSAPDSPEASREFAIHFEEQPRVAKRIRAWVDNIQPVLLRPEEAKKEWAKKHKSKGVKTQAL